MNGTTCTAALLILVAAQACVPKAAAFENLDFEATLLDVERKFEDSDYNSQVNGDPDGNDSRVGDTPIASSMGRFTYAVLLHRALRWTTTMAS